MRSDKERIVRVWDASGQTVERDEYGGIVDVHPGCWRPLLAHGPIYDASQAGAPPFDLDAAIASILADLGAGLSV